MKEINRTSWDTIIKPKTGLFDLNLREVWNYRDLLFLLVKRDFIAYYKQTVLGPVWFFIQPVFTMIMYMFIFGNLAGIPTDGIPKSVFYLTGIISWGYFSDCMFKTSNVFRENANIFGKVYFPRLIMPLSIVISNLLKMAVQIVLLGLMIAYYFLTGNADFHSTPYILLLPVFIMFLAILGLGFGMIVSSVTTKYRDLSLLVGFAMPLIMFTTPVVYPLSELGGLTRSIVAANPITPIIEGIRLGIFGKGVFDLFSFVYLTTVAFITLALGIVIFNKVEKNFVDTV